jgi:uncharacterized protein DUF2631
VAADHGHELSDGSSGHVAHERPEDWGWHHEFTKGRQIMGWFSVLALCLFFTTTHYNLAGAVAIGLTIAALVGGLIWDLQRTRKQWRS